MLAFRTLHRMNMRALLLLKPVLVLCYHAHYDLQIQSSKLAFSSITDTIIRHFIT
jgi:hypothetical protein